MCVFAEDEQEHLCPVHGHEKFAQHMAWKGSGTNKDTDKMHNDKMQRGTDRTSRGVKYL